MLFVVNIEILELFLFVTKLLCNFFFFRLVQRHIWFKTARNSFFLLPFLTFQTFQSAEPLQLKGCQ